MKSRSVRSRRKAPLLVKLRHMLGNIKWRVALLSLCALLIAFVYVASVIPMFGLAIIVDVTTGSASNITATQATLSGTVDSYSTNDVTVRGFEYGSTTSYGTNIEETTGSQNDDYTVGVTSLSCGTEYHFRAYATTADGTGYGSDQSFNTSACSSSQPTASTDGSTVLGQTSANLQGTATSSGGGKITQRGFRYGTTTDYGQTVNDDLSNELVYSGFWSVNSQPFYRLVGPSGGTATDAAGNVYTSGLDGTTIQKFSSGGILLQEWGRDDGGGPLNGASNLTIDDDGNIYVAELFADRVSKFNSNGEFQGEIGYSGSGNGGLYNPTAVAVDSQNNIFVTDSGNSRIQKFDQYGNYLDQWGSYGANNGQFNHPYSMAIDSNDNIFVADTDNHRIQKFDADGNYVGQTPWTTQWGGDWQNTNFTAQRYFPSGIAIGSDDTLYVSGYFDNTTETYASSTVVNIDGNLDYIGHIDLGTNVPPTGHLMFVLSLAVSDTGQVYLHGPNSIQKYEPNNNDGPFDFDIASLTCGTIYHYQAFAVNVSGTAYGQDSTFQTSSCDPVLPSVTTQSATQINQTNATIRGTVVGIGSGALTERGFQYGTSTSYSSTIFDNTSATGAFSRFIDNLQCGTLYHFRAYASSSAGRGNGADLVFNTAACSALPTVAVTEPYNNQKFGAGTKEVKLAATAASTTSSIDRVEFILDNVSVGTDSSLPYGVSASGLSAGSHTLIARAYDVLGSIVISAPVRFTIAAPSSPVPKTTPKTSAPTPTVSIGPNEPSSGLPVEQSSGGELPLRQKPRSSNHAYTLMPFWFLSLLLLVALMYSVQSYREYRRKQELIKILSYHQQLSHDVAVFLSLTSHYLHTSLTIMQSSLELLVSTKITTTKISQPIKVLLNNLSQFVETIQAESRNILIGNKIKQEKQAERVNVLTTFKKRKVWLPLVGVAVPLAIFDVIAIITGAYKDVRLQFLNQVLLFVFGAIIILVIVHFQRTQKLVLSFKEHLLFEEQTIHNQKIKYLEANAEKIHKYYDEISGVSKVLDNSEKTKLYFNGLAQFETLQQSLTRAGGFLRRNAHAEQVNLADTYSNVLDRLESKASEKHVQIVGEVNNDLVVNALTDEAEYLFFALIDNAIKFSPEGSEVLVSCTPHRQGARLRVSDSGNGISKEQISKLYQPFERGTPLETFDYEGMGLGLYSLKILVDKLSGKLTVENRSGHRQGVVAEIIFPTDHEKNANRQSGKVINPQK